MLQCSIVLSIDLGFSRVNIEPGVLHCNMATAGKPPVIVIKKYSNRRLYDTAGSRYVNLDDIGSLIRQGREVQVLDAETGEDLTRLILTQIIVEDAKGKPSGLPLELLRQLIVASDYARHEFLTWYLRSAFEAYEKVQETVQSRLHDMGAAAFNPIQRVTTFLSGALTPETPAKNVDREAELEHLRRRVAELEAALNAREQSKPRTPRKRKST